MKLLKNLLKGSFFGLITLLCACTDDDGDRFAGHDDTIEVRFSTTVSDASRATRALTEVIGERWEHEINDLWVLLVAKEGDNVVLRYKFHFAQSATAAANDRKGLDGHLAVQTETPYLHYLTSPKHIVAGTYWPLCLANVPVPSDLNKLLTELPANGSDITTVYKTLVRTQTGVNTADPSLETKPVRAYELRDESAAYRFFASNCFYMDATTEKPVGRWPAYAGQNGGAVTLKRDDQLEVKLNRWMAKLRLYVNTVDDANQVYTAAKGFKLDEVNFIKVPNHRFYVWNPLGTQGAYNGFDTPANNLEDDKTTVNSNWTRFPLLNAIHTAAISDANAPRERVKVMSTDPEPTPALSYYFMPDVEMTWNPALASPLRTPATLLQLKFSQGTKAFTYDIPYIGSWMAYPYIMGNMLYDIYVTFKGSETMDVNVSINPWNATASPQEWTLDDTAHRQVFKVVATDAWQDESEQPIAFK